MAQYCRLPLPGIRHAQSRPSDLEPRGCRQQNDARGDLRGTEASTRLGAKVNARRISAIALRGGGLASSAAQSRDKAGFSCGMGRLPIAVATAGARPCARLERKQWPRYTACLKREYSALSRYPRSHRVNPVFPFAATHDARLEAFIAAGVDHAPLGLPPDPCERFLLPG